ncbi:GyrI-like domain-containing protein [candidate division WOR-3 bacterium]|nr:GyrI-like domain-containing protein [candidate division WOR-3 bacterium]
MKPKIVDKKRITLVGVDFFGNPYEKAAGWSEQNAIGELWKRITRFTEKNKDSIKNLVSESGYELWIDFEEEKESGNKYIFTGLEVSRLEDTPLELVAKVLPETRYAVFTFKMEEIKSDWSKTQEIWSKWLPEQGLEPSFDYMIEYYDTERFKGMDDPESELDFMVPIE